MKAIGKLVGGVVAAGAAVYGGVNASGDETTRNDNGEIVESGGLGVMAMQDGDCFVLPDEELITSVEAVPCTSPHSGQKFADVALSDAAVFGEADAEVVLADEVRFDDAVFEASMDLCFDRFEGFVGASYDESALYFNALTPTVTGWQLGDREATCVIVPETGLISFDAEGSGR